MPPLIRVRYQNEKPQRHIAQLPRRDSASCLATVFDPLDCSRVSPWRHFGDIAHPDSFVFTYLTHNPHDHLTWTEEIHSTHISSGSEDSNTGGSPDFYEAM